MKSKDQILLEEAYKQVSSAKIVRRATEEELNRMEEYCNEQFKPDFLKSYDFSKGWVWDLEDEGDYFVSIKDSDPVKCNATKMKGYATIGLSRIDKEDIYWMGQVDSLHQEKPGTTSTLLRDMRDY